MMKHHMLAGFAFVSVVLLVHGQADAQVGWYVGPRIGYGGYGYGGYGGASTPASAAGMAMADIVRSQGAYNQMTSAAMINVESARSKYIENQRQWTDVYLMKQRALAAQHAEQKEQIRARNARYLEDQANQPSHLPPRLVSSQLDPSSGKINWPAALMRDSFAEQRREIEALFASRSTTGSSSELSQAIYTKTREMQDNLRAQIREIVTQEYLDARKFLESLSLEGRFPTG